MNKDLNKILLRQIKRHFGAATDLPEELQHFIYDINETYNSLEDDAKLYQNSLDVSSLELREAFQKHKEDADTQKDLIKKIKEAISALGPGPEEQTTEKSDGSSAFLLESLLSLIEEHKQMAVSLKESEFYLREILDSQDVGVVIIDSETREISFVNSKGAALYGAAKEELIGKICHGSICTTPCGDCNISETLRLVKSSEKKLLNVHGELIPIIKSVVETTFNNRKSLVESFVDITDRKKAEEELIRAKEEAVAGSLAKSEFLANMSHEIRTPLNGVIGFTDLVMKTKLSETQQQYTSTISQSANALLDIINDILDFSKIEAGKLELNTAKSDLLEIGNQVADMVKFQANKKGLELLLNISPKVPRYIWVDEVRLKQVLLNVLGNAVKFTQSGEIEFKIELLPATDANLTTFRFSVRDTGIGISEKHQKRIFEAFSQEDSSTTKRFGGTGLGLAISNKLLALMGSELKLKSEPGSGSTFDFVVSFKSMDGEPEAWENESHIRKVLVVDDNDNNRFILKEMLASKHIACTQASGGTEALELFKSGHAFDAIIMDYRMPYMDGITTIRNIRSMMNRSPAQLPVILLSSSYDDEVFIAASAELKIRFILEKPIKIQQLFSTLSQLHLESSPGFPEIITSTPIKMQIIDNRLITILIAEDNKVNMLLARSILGGMFPNATIVEAYDGQSAIEKFKIHSPDIVFMDVQMPVMNGYEATQEIRKLENSRAVPIIALTAGTVKGERDKCLAAGMDDYVSKPIIKNSIDLIIEKWLNPVS
ncbi:MAG: response regulator [Bacteroidota bacterium]